MSSKLESTIEEYVIDQLFNGAVSVNGKTKKPKFAKDGSVDFSKASYVSLTGDAVFFALGNANVTAYYWNEKLDTTVAKTVAAGTVNNWGQAATSLTFARKAVTKKVYATGVDVTLFDTTGGDIFAGAYNKYDKKNANAALSKTEGDVEITILNSTVKNVYAGGEGDDVYYGDVTVNVSNSKVGKIYAGGKTGAYTIGDLTVNITNDGNQMNGAAGYVFSGAIFGTPADKKSQSIGKTYVNVDNYNGAFKGALNYVEKVSVTGDSNVVFNGNFKEVDTISVVGGAIAEIKKGGAYEYEFVLNGDTVGNNNTAMLTLAKKLNPKKISIVVNNDFAHNGSVNLINWAGYVPSKKNVVILPNPTVKNERGGIIADYMYSYDFDAANQLIFTYTGEAYVLVANDYTFGLADDVVLMSGMYDYTDKIVDLKGGLNSIDLGDSTRQGKEFKLTVTEASENVVNAEDFAADVVISDRQSKGKNVVIAGTATGNVDFNKSAEAVLEVTGDFDGNVDFTSVKGSAQVKLDNNASINAGSIESGENLVEVVVDAYSEATVKDLDFDAYLSGAAAGEYGDFLLNIGDNAVVSNGNDEILVNNYNRNEVVENSDVTLYVMGEASGNTLVKGDAEFSVKNYGEVSGDINASYLYDIDGNKINRKDASVKFQNHGVFSGSINMDEQNGNDVFANASVLGSVTGNATVTADAEINFGGGKDKLQFFGNNTFEGNVTKLETSKLEMEFKRGVTDYNGTISYTQAFDAAPENGVVDGRYPAESDKFTGYDNTKVTVKDAIVNVADGKELIANEIVVDNGKINGDFDFKKLTLANGTFVLDENMSFDGYDGEGATLEIGDNVNLYAQDLTLGTITTGDNAYLNTKNLTATMGDIAIDGAADVDGDATAAKNVVLEGTEFNVTGTVAAGEDVIVDADKLTAGAITAGKDVDVDADTVVSGAITADGNVDVASENAAVTGDVTAANVEIYGNAVIDGNVNATEEDVVLNADDAIAVTGDVTAQGIIDIDGTVSASDIEAVGAVTADGKLTADNVTGSNVAINGEAAVAGAITATEADVTLNGVISAAAVNAVKDAVTATMDVRNTMNLGEITAANVYLTAENAFAENLTSTKVDDEAADIINVGNITAKAVEDNPDTIGVDESRNGDVIFDGDGIINAKDIIADGAFNSTIADLTAGSIDAGSVAIDGTAKVADITADTFVDLDNDVTAANITAGGAFTADGKLTADSIDAGSVAIDGTATVTGDITADTFVDLDQDVTAANITAGGAFTADGKLTADSIDADSVAIVGTATVAGNITATNAVTADGKLTAADVTGSAVNLKTDVNVKNVKATEGNVIISSLRAASVVDGTVTADKGDVTLAANPADASLTAGAVTAAGNANLVGAGYVKVADVNAADVKVTAGKAEVAAIDATNTVTVDTDDVTIASINAGGAVTIDSADAKVNGIIDAGSVAINGTAKVTGDITADTFVDLDNDVTAAAITAGGAFTADGKLTADSIQADSVAIDGTATVAGNITATNAVTADGKLTAASVTGKNVELTGDAKVTGAVTATEGNVNVATYDDAAAQNIEIGSISAVLGAADINAADLNDNVLVGAIDAKSVTLSGEGVMKTGAVTATGEFVSTAKDATIESIDAGNVTITTVGGTKVGNIDSEDSVNLTANNVAAVIIADAVTAKGDVAVNGAGKVTAASVDGNNVNVNGNASIDTVVAAKSAVVNGNLEADSVQGADVVVNGTAKVTGAVSAVENLVTVNVDGVLNAGSISGKTGVIVAGVADVTAGVTSAEGDIIVEGKLAAAGTVEALKGAVGVNGSMQAGAVNADSVKVAGTAKVTGAVTATKDVVVVGGTLNADSIDAENVDVKGVVNVAGAITATGKVALATNDDAVADTIKVGSIAAEGDVVLTAYANDKIEVGDLAGNNVYFNGNGTVAFLGDVTLGGNVTAKGDLAINVTNVEFNGKVTAKTLNISEGQTFTFNAGAEIDTVTVKDASAADAAINIKNADAIFLNVAVEADAALALELKGQNLEGAATLADNAKITVANGNFVGTITETGVNATVALKDATVTEVVFAGSNIEVENSGIVETLTIVNTLNITGVVSGTNDVVDEFTVKSDIDAAAATITIYNAVTYFQNVAATVAVSDGAFNALSFAGSATGNGAVAIENWDDASGANSLNVGSIDITAQTADITGAMTATNGGIKVAGAKVAGNVTANRTEDGESVVDFAVADAYAGTIAATATAGAINMNIAGDLSGAAVNLDGAGVTLTTDSSFVAWNEGKTEIAANSNVVLANDANMNVNGDYVGNLNGGDIAIDGKFFGAYVGNEIVKATADVNSLTVNGNDAYGNTAAAFANAVFASSNKDAAAEVVKAINAKYQAGFVYADVTANGDVTVNQAMTGAVTAGGKFTVGAYETKMDSIVYVDPSDVDAFQKVATVVDNLNVDSLDAASVKGQTVYYVNQDYKDNANPEHNDVRLVVTVINGVNVTVDGENAAVSGDFYGNMTAEKAAVVMNGNILGGWAHTDGKGNWMLPDTDPSYQAEDVYEKATIVAGSFESTAEGKKIYADITAKVADINVVSDVEGNLTAEVGSVIAGNNVNGDVKAGKDVNIINGTVDGYVDADGDVNVLNVTGTVDGNNINSKGTIDGKVTAANDAFVNVVNDDIVAGNDVTATGVITGNITAGNDVTAEDVVKGNINAKGVVNATDVTGYVYTDGNVTANKVDGTVDGYDVTVVTAGGKVTAANNAIVDVAMNGIEAANDATVKVSANGNVTAGNNVFADAAAINGDVTATLGEVKAASVNGSITAGTDVTVTGTVTAPGAVPTAVVAGGTVNIGGQVGKAGEAVDVTAGADAIFGAAVYGNVNAVGYVDANDVTGDITAGGYVEANDVTGDITAGDYVAANDVTGDITAENNIEANDVVGAVESVNGNITLNSVVGDVTALNGDVTVATTVNSDGYAAVTAQNVTIGGQAGDAINTVDIIATESATLGGDVYGSVSAETVTKDGAITKITGDVTASDIALEAVNVEGNVTAAEGKVVVGNVGMNLAYTGAGSIAAGNVGGDFSYTADAGVVDNIVVGNVAGSIDVTASIDEEEQAGGITVKVGNVGAADAAADHIYLAGEEKLLHDHEVGALTVNTVLNFTAGEVYVDNFNIDGKSIANITATSIQGATVENVGVDKVYNGVFLNASDCVKLTITGDIRIASATVTNAEFVVDGNVTATETWTWNGVDAYEFDSRVAADVAAKNINISGNAEVSLNAENVTVGGNVIGNITADIADVEGDVTGNVTADVVTVGGNAKGVFVAETIEIGKDFNGEATGKTAEATFVANGNFNGTANGFESVTIGGNATLTGDLEADTINFNGTTVVLNGNGNEITAANLNFAADVDLTAGDIDLNGADLTVKNFTANAGVVDAGDITFTGTATVAGDFTGTLIGTDADNTLVLKGAFNGTFDLGEGYDKIDVDTDVTLAGLTGVEVLDIAKDATLTFSSTFELTSALEVSLDAGTDGEDAIVNVTLGADLDKLFIGGADWVWDSVNSRFAVAGATTGDACLTYDDANDKLTWGTIA
ncbi:MAG: hypothetical protein IKB71_11030 [Lentisphaeria bacterium]|nr:hypothetical protein [Lentisphaeria bacterium]